jgi:capsid portal protein
MTSKILQSTYFYDFGPNYKKWKMIGIPAQYCYSENFRSTITSAFADNIFCITEKGTRKWIKRKNDKRKYVKKADRKELLFRVLKSELIK